MIHAPLATRIAVNGFAGLVLAFLLVPILAVVPASFNEASFIRLPPEETSLRWYGVFMSDREWLTSLLTSLQVAVLTSLAATSMGTMAALALWRLSGWPRMLVTGLVAAPLIVPVIITAVALYYVGQYVGLVGTIPGLVMGHMLLCLPFAVINVGISLRSVDPNWLRAAEGLGAGPFEVFRTVTLPNIVPGVVGGAVFAFVTSFDEVIISIFMASTHTKTLPVKMWEIIRLEFTPVVAVAATLFIVLTLAMFLAFRALQPSNKTGV